MGAHNNPSNATVAGICESDSTDSKSCPLITEIPKDVSDPEIEREETEVSQYSLRLAKEIGTDWNFKREVVWFNAIGLLIMHLGAIFGIGLMFGGYAKIWTSIYSFLMIYVSSEGITIGAHRLWSHKSFKAGRGLKTVLIFLQTMAGQNCVWEWVRDHRQHHKYSDTDADPHNANRGFFFSHIGWLMSRKHPKVIEYGKKIDMSDLEADPYIMFQKKYYLYLYFIVSVWLPVMIPIKLWGEEPWIAFLTAYLARAVLNYNGTWLVNSAAHLYGTRPYDKRISPVESRFVGFISIGEGWHNYHHTFPWDYKASELGAPWNVTRVLIDYFAAKGWVWDRREANQGMIQKRLIRTGDGTYEVQFTLKKE